MKKIAILATVIAMLAVFTVAPAFAAETSEVVIDTTSAILEQNSETKTVSVPVSVSADSSMGMTAFGNFELSLNVPAGVTLTSAALATDNGYAWTNDSIPANGFVAFQDGSGVGVDVMADPTTMKFVLNFTVADTSVVADYVIGVNYAIACDFMDFNDQFTTVPENFTISVKGEDKPTVITKVNSDVTDVIDAPYWQKGQGAMIEFNTADLADFVAMNWVLNLEDGTKRFAKASDFSVEGVASETVQFFATFVVNANADDAGLVISSVDAGFKKNADETVYKTFAE